MPNAKRQVKLSREKKVARRMSRTDPQVLRGSLFGGMLSCALNVLLERVQRTEYRKDGRRKLLRETRVGGGAPGDAYGTTEESVVAESGGSCYFAPSIARTASRTRAMRSSACGSMAGAASIRCRSGAYAPLSLS